MTRKLGLSVILLIVVLMIILTTFCPVNSAAFQPTRFTPDSLSVFPNAQGFGTGTPGGRGGKVIYVTTLEDAGPGSFRQALLTAGPRMVLFRVAGTIKLENDIIVTSPFMTVAGQTAPGEGVQIRGAQIRINTHDVVIRYLKVRSGDEGKKNQAADRDAISINHTSQAYNVVIDHCTLLWGPDIGGLSILNGSHDVTVSYTILGEGLYLSRHPEATARLNGHSMAMNISELNSKNHPQRITIHHNLFTTSADRNPRVVGGENIDIVNNVIYNWRFAATQGNPRSVNLIKNRYIPGPMTTHPDGMGVWLPRVEKGNTLHRNAVFELGNWVDGYLALAGDPQYVYSQEPFSPYSMQEEDSPPQAYRRILSDVGANLQVAGSDGRLVFYRDSVDQEIISNLQKRQGSFVNGIDSDGLSGFPAINWPILTGDSPAQDDDLDGLPDDWELYYFGHLRRGDPASSRGDRDADGYTDLEEYLNQTNPNQ